MHSDHEDRAGGTATTVDVPADVPAAGGSRYTARAPKPAAAAQAVSDAHRQGMELLISAVEQLSLARSLHELTAIVRTVARQLVHADGSCFVLRQGDDSHYVDEDAIAPLWKGKRFPLSSCVSGWAMLERRAAVIPDVYADERVPVEAYRPTFVKSMVMVPIRKSEPVGAIGIYWGWQHAASDWEVRLLQALADSTAVAMENIRVYSELEAQVKQRTQQLEAANRELAAFADSVSHDLKAPLRRIQSYSVALAEDYPKQLDATGREYLRCLETSAESMTQMVDALLQLSQLGQAALRRVEVDLSRLVRGIAAELSREDPARRVEFEIESDVQAQADAELSRIVLANLLRNAWKFTQEKPEPRVAFGVKRRQPGAPAVYFVRDNGAGFRMDYADQLFLPFRRLHSEQQFPGTGIGLATVQRIVHRHEGRVWAEAIDGEGACFYWTFAPGPTE